MRPRGIIVMRMIHPPSLDLAQYIQQGVSEALRLPQLAATGLYSDQLMKYRQVLVFCG